MLELRFKGERDYLHGTDIYNALLPRLQQHFGEISALDLAFHRIARTQLDMVDQNPDGNSAAVCNFTAGLARHTIHLVESGRPVVRRYPFPEDAIASEISFDSVMRSACLRGQPNHTAIDIWVAMTKALHKHLLPGTWLFARARLPRPLPDSPAVERRVRIAAQMGNHLTRCVLSHDGADHGEIYFARP